LIVWQKSELNLSTVSFTDLGKLTLVKICNLLAPANFHYCPSYLKNDAQFKSGQNPVEYSHLSSLI
jgi:hypothetical protein